MRSLDEINQRLAEAEENLATLNARQAELLRQITELQQEKASLLHGQKTPLPPGKSPLVTNQSSQEAKITLFRSLFRGREDVYPKRFESLKTGNKQREQLAEQIAGLPADQPRIIVATGRYLGEGFDDERLDTLFWALPISWRGTLTHA